MAILPLSEERSSQKKKIQNFSLRQLRILASKYYAHCRKKFPAKKLYIYIYISHVGCQMSLLLEDPGTRWTRTAEPSVAGSSSYSLYHGILVKRTILILELPADLLGREILTENFLIQVLAGGRSRTGEPWVVWPSSYPLDHEVLVEIIISDLPDEV